MPGYQVPLDNVTRAGDVQGNCFTCEIVKELTLLLRFPGSSKSEMGHSKCLSILELTKLMKRQFKSQDWGCDPMTAFWPGPYRTKVVLDIYPAKKGSNQQKGGL